MRELVLNEFVFDHIVDLNWLDTAVLLNEIKGKLL